jgi:hypothetical protein
VLFPCPAVVADLPPVPGQGVGDHQGLLPVGSALGDFHAEDLLNPFPQHLAHDLVEEVVPASETPHRHLAVDAVALENKGLELFSVHIAEDLFEPAYPGPFADFLEDLEDVGAAEDVLIGVALAIAGGGLFAVGTIQQVVFLAFAGIGEDGIGLIDLLHAGRGLGIVEIAVRVIPEGQLAVGLLDFPGVGLAADAENLIVVLV